VTKADVAELVDARDLKSLDGNVVWVRVPPPAPMADNDSGPETPFGTRRRIQNQPPTSIYLAGAAELAGGIGTIGGLAAAEMLRRAS
jgi:hypothetical protein